MIFLDDNRYLLHVRLARYRKLLLQTNKFIFESLQRIIQPYVACSFGKDSSVLLHLMLINKPNIAVRFARHPETNILDDYERIIAWWKRNYDINLEEVFCEGGLVKIKHHQREMLNAGNWDSFFLGIRAEESQGRMFSLKRYGQFHRLKNGRVKISPLAWWREADIAAYIQTQKLPLLDKYGHGGIGARTTSGIPRTHINESLLSLKQRDVSAFNQMCQLFGEEVNYFV